VLGSWSRQEKNQAPVAFICVSSSLIRCHVACISASVLGAGDTAVVARHARPLKGDEVLVLDHYLEVLAIKTGAFPGATALARARSGGVFGPTHERFWAEARRRLGDSDGTRALIEVLLLHRSIPADALAAGMQRALTAGSIDAAVVAIEARRAHEPTVAAVIPIGEGLSRFDRPAPSVANYDDLLEAR
jgi:hypothetical protein